jgi:cytochrome bd-type quinol oxidase subunit 2
MMPITWAAQSATSVKQAADQWLQFVADGLAWVAAVIQAAWAWTSDQIVKMTQAPWETWPLWKQLALIIVAAAVIYTLFLAARQLWWAVLNLLSAIAAFIGTLIVTLPMILLAGAVALAGLWLINNFHDLSSLRPPQGGEAPQDPARQ